MNPLRILIDDLRAWKRLSFTGGEWAMLYGFTAGVVPAVSGALAMLGFHLLVSIIEHRFDLTGRDRLERIAPRQRLIVEHDVVLGEDRTCKFDSVTG